MIKTINYKFLLCILFFWVDQSSHAAENADEKNNEIARSEIIGLEEGSFFQKQHWCVIGIDGVILSTKGCTRKQTKVKNQISAGPRRLSLSFDYIRPKPAVLDVITASSELTLVVKENTLYIVKGEYRNNLASFWIEDIKSGQRVTEIVSVPVAINRTIYEVEIQ